MQTDLETLRQYVGKLLINGKLTKNTAQSYWSSIDRVFGAASADQKADVLGVDLEELFFSFREHNPDLESNTISSYEGRVRAVINRFAREVGGAPETNDENQRSALEAVRVPLRPGVTVRIDGLPADLTVPEARRIASFVAAMVGIDASATS